METRLKWFKQIIGDQVVFELGGNMFQKREIQDDSEIAQDIRVESRFFSVELDCNCRCQTQVIGLICCLAKHILFYSILFVV